jgi:hypothetical protein
VAICTEHLASGGLPGSGAAAAFADGGSLPAQESLIRVRVWARGQGSATTAQMEGLARAIH